ncbi:phosphate ABC transporter, inner membrane subunit PstC [Catenulispora acidiphila DSM 44928]|uniref:Phosphate ABC transporter, inner membrane subunit PstC n=1 Tax=Catenulispora acidiphila (strain DSM 44928 / JCM 14897 / NBRC 102108 / NRRL B-24433 / ID139908) TaxID=479433 RepID=C7QKI6_CATAD|nr:phosphate ABC transporter permease subunit PstC [Catenulispora acidiphila]ACU77085.1 phosphate ABC transporter, inner membrane subunit PstC [Catenulispora acidiphila DSM 44928]
MSGIAPTATRPTPRRGGSDAGTLNSGTRRGDAVFSGTVRGAAIFLLALMAAIATFLVWRATDALSVNKANVLTYTGQWAPDDAPPKFGIGAAAWGTLVTSTIAIVIAAPVAIGVSLFITQYAPRRLAQVLGYIVDLLAAVPSIVYGLWGILFLVPHMQGASQFVSDVLGWIPMFSSGIFGRSVFTAGVILAIMILPIIAAISREVFLQTPREQVEAAYALGATRWEMIKLAVLPYGRSGVGSAIVLGFGRALGETVAVAMVLSVSYNFVTKWLQPGGNTIAANIALQFSNAFKTGQGALIASGLVLFVVTFLVNLLARRITARADIPKDERWSLFSVFRGRSGRAGGSEATSVAIASGTAITGAAEVPDGRGAFEAKDTPGEVAADDTAGRSRTRRAAHGTIGGGVLIPPSTPRRIRSGFAGGATVATFVLAVLPLLSILWLVVSKGTKALNAEFLTHSLRNISEDQTGGGVYHAILGTLEQAGLATLMAVPIGILVAVYLVEYGKGMLAKSVTFFVDVMMGLPSIVAGLFILSLWIITLHQYQNGLAGALALMILMLPVVIRSSEEMLKLVPDSLREASYALGVPKWRTITRVVIPTALPGIITGVMLGVARVMGETAPILLVVSYVAYINPNPFSGVQGQATLPTVIYNTYTSSEHASNDRTWAAALLLIIIIMLLNILARVIAWWKTPGRA